MVVFSPCGYDNCHISGILTAIYQGYLLNDKTFASVTSLKAENFKLFVSWFTVWVFFLFGLVNFFASWLLQIFTWEKRIVHTGIYQ